MLYNVIDDLNVYLGGPYGLMVIILLIAFTIAYFLIFRLAKSNNFGILLIFTGIFIMIANAVEIDTTATTFFIGVFLVVIGLYVCIQRRENY